MNTMNTAPKDKPILGYTSDGKRLNVMWYPLYDDGNGSEGGWRNTYTNEIEHIVGWDR